MFFAGASRCAVIDAVVGGENYDIYENSIISENSIIESENLNITNSLILENYGTIENDIYVYDNYVLNLENYGVISGDIYLGNNSSLFQIIRDSDDISSLDTNSAFSILVQSQDFLSWTNIINNADGADKIILEDVNVLLDSFDNISMEIQLSGENILTINDIDLLLNNVVFSNVSGDGSLTVLADDLNSLYKIKTIRDDNKIYFEMYRETDYIKILDYKNGAILNSMRTSSVNSRLLSAMDRASSVSELYDVMGKSVMFNPINLMLPIKTFNNFESYDFDNKDLNDAGLKLTPTYIQGSGLNLYSGKVSVFADYNDWDFVFSSYVGNFTESDNINNFSGFLYGGNIKAFYNKDNIFMNVLFGYTGAKFKTSGVLNSDILVYAPSGRSIYGDMYIGKKFNFNDFYLSSFGGIGAVRSSVLNYTETDVYARFGGAAGFGFEQMGLSYDYSVFLSAQTDMVQTAGIKMEIWSILDGAGGSLSYQILNNEMGISSKFSADLKFVF